MPFGEGDHLTDLQIAPEGYRHRAQRRRSGHQQRHGQNERKTADTREAAAALGRHEQFAETDHDRDAHGAGRKGAQHRGGERPAPARHGEGPERHVASEQVLLHDHSHGASAAGDDGDECEQSDGAQWAGVGPRRGPSRWP